MSTYATLKPLPVFPSQNLPKGLSKHLRAILVVVNGIRQSIFIQISCSAVSMILTSESLFCHKCMPLWLCNFSTVHVCFQINIRIMSSLIHWLHFNVLHELNMKASNWGKNSLSGITCWCLSVSKFMLSFLPR